MRKKLRVQSFKITSLAKFMKLNSVFPFTEQPGTDRYESKETTVTDPATNTQAVTDQKNIGATDLFSLFTADIIREEAVFTR